MKIKVNKEKHKQTKNKIFKGFRINQRLRLLIIGLLLIFLLASTMNTYGSYQKPETQEKSDVILSYTKEGIYTYDIYLLNNTIYDDAEILPAGKTAFRQIIDRVEADFEYRFSVNSYAELNGNYKIDAILQTDIWSKTYTIKAQSSFSDMNVRRYNFTESFPIDYGYYETKLQQIEEETGVTAPNPTLIIKSSVSINAETKDGEISESFQPSLTIPLKGKTLEISKDPSNSIAGVKTEKTTLTNDDVIRERNNNTMITVIIFIIFIICCVFLRNNKKEGITDKIINKINKKYGEWIVEVEKLPKNQISSKTINVQTMEGLVKTSEELGKPIFHYKSMDQSQHIFSVLENDTSYEYSISLDGKINKNVKCPECGKKFNIQGKPGEKINVQCPYCGKKGTVKI